MNLLAKLPNDGSADPLSVVYDVDLTIPADKVVRLNLMPILVKKFYVSFLAGRTISHGNRCSQLNPGCVQQHHHHNLVAITVIKIIIILMIIITIMIMMMMITRRVTSPLSCRVDHRHCQVWCQPLLPHIYRFIVH